MEVPPVAESVEELRQGAGAQAIATAHSPKAKRRQGWGQKSGSSSVSTEVLAFLSYPVSPDAVTPTSARTFVRARLPGIDAFGEFGTACWCCSPLSKALVQRCGLALASWRRGPPFLSKGVVSHRAAIPAIEICFAAPVHAPCPRVYRVIAAVFPMG